MPRHKGCKLGKKEEKFLEHVRERMNENCVWEEFFKGLKSERIEEILHNSFVREAQKENFGVFGQHFVLL